MTFSEYRRFLAGCDVLLDLFDRTRERELAVITRSIVALCSGKPVVHPPFTEVSPLIERYDAGWLVDPADPGRVAGVLSEIVDQPQLVAEKARGARAMWERELDPAVAIEGLVRVIRQVSRPVSAAAPSPAAGGPEPPAETEAAAPTESTA
jgi:glycosyltransferase involved in cell wall biosynthesis